MTRASEDWGGPLAIDVTALVAIGLALWIPSVPDADSAHYVASNITNVTGAMIAASVLIVATLFLLAYAGGWATRSPATALSAPARASSLWARCRTWSGTRWF
jgi:hypothetical protein